MVPDPKKPMRRSSRMAMMGGVCAGVADWLGWDVTLVRVLTVLLAVFTGVVPVAVVYVVFWAIIPPEDPMG